MSLLLRTIVAFPRGRSSAELIALLDLTFKGQERDRLVRELDALATDGRIRLTRDGKWVATSRISLSSTAAFGRNVLLEEIETDRLIATPAEFVLESVVALDELETDFAGRPDPRALLRYYRAAVRSDPRGALTQSEDRHGIAFQLVSGQGRLAATEDGEIWVIRINLNDLPGSFREALSRRDANENAFAVGWPIAVARQSGAPAILPVGLMTGVWERTADQLIIRVETDDVLINPNWIQAASRSSAWKQRNLQAYLSSGEGPGLPFEDFRARLAEAMASSISGRLSGISYKSSLDPAEVGIFDALGLFLATDSTFTAGIVRDLDVMATWSPDKISATALAPLLGMTATQEGKPCAPVSTGPINAEQLGAVHAAMTAPLTVVTGPPGTGKSQAIVAMAATALLNGQRVLVASKNHQALDAVMERLAVIASEAPFMIRTLDPARDVDQGVKDVLADLVRVTSVARPTADAEAKRKLLVICEERHAVMQAIDQRRRLHVELADLLERDLVPDGQAGSQPSQARASLWIRLLAYLGLERIKSETSSPGVSRVAKDRDRIKQLRAELDQIDITVDPVTLSAQIADSAGPVLRRELGRIAAVAESVRVALSDARDDLELSGQTELDRDLLDAVLTHRPLWLASILGTPRRIPLADGLFDLVIFDEASQCDIGSALPLLARAKRAVVVGDERQLAFIPQIGAAQDRNLMASQRLPLTGMGRFAQGRKSLFDLALKSPGAVQVMLRDQYRSAPDIVDYINAEFYGRKLRVAVDLGGLRPPHGVRPGLVWKDVGPGPPAGAAGNVNKAEVDAVAAHLRQLLLDQNYGGSVGVISPFRQQVLAIEQRLAADLPADVIRKADLRVATVDGFQGQ